MTDYIERQAAIEVLCLDCSEANICGGTCDDTDRIREIPPADVRPVVEGEWIQHFETTEDNETMECGWECSICGRWEMEKQPFCNCGADMRGGDAE